jgi:hypothetical protein
MEFFMRFNCATKSWGWGFRTVKMVENQWFSEVEILVFQLFFLPMIKKLEIVTWRFEIVQVIVKRRGRHCRDAGRTQ